jgi:hypothetical protein
MAYLWEYILGVDRELDLTSPRRGREWAGNDCLGPELEGDWDRSIASLRNPETSEPWFELYARNVRALRSLVKRLKPSERPRRSGIADTAADEIFELYLDLPACVGLVRKDDPEPTRRRKKFRPAKNWEEIRKRARDETPPLTLKNFLTVRLRSGGASPFHRYWQDVFLTLVGSLVNTPLAAQTCPVCGKDLDRTKTGRVSRRGMCKRCGHRKWREKEGPKRMQERWARTKQKQRRQEELAKQATKLRGGHHATQAPGSSRG